MPVTIKKSFEILELTSCKRCGKSNEDKKRQSVTELEML